MRKRLIAILAILVTCIAEPHNVSAGTYTTKDVETLAKMQELDEAMNPGKNGVCEVTLYEGQKITTSGTQGMLLPAGCVDDGGFCIGTHLEAVAENVPYEPLYSTGRDLREVDITDSEKNSFCRVAYTMDLKNYTYTAGDDYRYVNFSIYGIKAGTYTVTYRHYDSYVKTYEEYEDEEGFECVREIEHAPSLEYTFKLIIHVLPQEVEKRYYVLKPGASLTPKTPTAVDTRYYVSSANDIKVTSKKLALHEYEEVLTIKENKNNIFTQKGKRIVAKKSKAEYGQWISMYAPYYDLEGKFQGVSEYSRFHVTVSNTNLNYTKKTMKVGDTIQIKIKDGTTYSRIEAFKYTDEGEESFAYVYSSGKTYKDKVSYADKGKQTVKFTTEQKGFDKNDQAFKYVTVKATKKGKCLIKVYPYEDDKDYFFVCEITVK